MGQSVSILPLMCIIQTALEIALGASSQHIIVEDENAATKAIDFLKRNRAGRATFLPLTTINTRTISSQNQDAIAASPGFLGMADELVTFDTRLEAIFKNLLATTAIFDTVEHARAAARQVRYQVRMGNPLMDRVAYRWFLCRWSQSPE